MTGAYFQPSEEAYRKLLSSFPFVTCVEVHTDDLPQWSATYSVLCTLDKGVDFDKCKQVLTSTLELVSNGLSVRLDCLIVENSPTGEAREVVWRLGGEMD